MIKYFIDRFQNLSKNRFFKGVLVISSGTALSQLIGIASMPIITRLYSPSDFGILVAYTSILITVVVFLSLRYEFALPLPKDDQQAADLMALCVVLVFVSTIVTWVILAIGGNAISEKVLGEHSGLAEVIIPLFLLSSFGGGIYQVFNYWMVRKRDYTPIAWTKISQSLGGSLSKLAFGVLKLGAEGLLFGELIAKLSGIRTLCVSIWRNDRELLKNISISGMRHVAIEFKTFPLFSLPASAFNTIALQLPALVLACIYGVQVAGWYGLANGILTIPALLISGSISQVYFGEVAVLIRDNPGQLKSFYKKTLTRLTVIAVPLVTAIVMLAPALFPPIFGKEWLTAGLYCLPLSLVALPSFIASPTSSLGSYGFNNWQLVFDISRTALIALVSYVVYKLKMNEISYMILYGVVMFCMYMILIFLNFSAIRILNTRRLGQEI